MRVTSQVAAKKVRELKEKIDQAKLIDGKSRVFVASIEEDPETVRPSYDFIESSKEIDRLETKLRRIKHAVNLFNVSTKLIFYDITIDEALVMLPQLTDEKKRLTEMAGKLPKERKINRYGNNHIIDYEYANYDIELVKQTLEKTSKLLSGMQNELNRINTTVEFEIPD